MIRAKLTNGAVERFTCRAGRTQDVLWDGEVKGFGVRLSAKSGTRTYFFQYRVKGTKKERQITIGRHNDPWRIDQARAKATELKAKMLGGVDPVAEAQRKQAEQEQRAALNQAQSTTLRQGLEHYLTHHRTKHGPLRPKTQMDYRYHCENYLATWLDEPVAQITRNKCLSKFVELSERGPKQANLCMAYLRALLNHAREMHATDDGEYPVLPFNPVTAMFRLRKPNPEKARTTRIPLDRVGKVWLKLRRRAAEARTLHERTAADWVSLMLLTGMRRTESGSLKWTDVDFDSKIITLCPEIVKNHNGLALPASTVLHEILSARKSQPEAEKVVRRRRVQRALEYVFASNGKKTPYMTDARATLDAVSEVAGLHISPHALRRTAEDIAKAVKVDSDERRQILNHLADDVHGRSYANNPDPEVLRPAVEAVARFITDAAKVAEAQESGANVIAFSGKPV